MQYQPFFQPMRISPVIIFVFLLNTNVLAQYLPSLTNDFWQPQSPQISLGKLRQRNFGAILGLQRGKYTFLEFGAEHHWRTISLTKPRIYAVSANAAYSIGQNVLGYNASFWMKQGRINLTYGFNAVYLTDFTNGRYGGGPMVGFRLLGFHLNTGYNFLAGNKEEGVGLTRVNPLYVSLRYYFPISNDFEWDRSKKEKAKVKEKTKRKRQKEKTKRKKRKAKEKKRKQEDNGNKQEKQNWQWPFKLK